MQEHTEDVELNIIKKVRAGEINAFEYLIKKYERALFIMIKNIIKEPYNSEDLLQEVFLAAYKNINSFNPDLSRFSTWLFKIARNKCLNEVKKKKVTLMSNLPDIAGKEDPADNVLKEEAFMKLDNALDQLPINYRIIFILSEFENLSYKEISEIEDIAIGTVKSRLSRTKEKLQKILKEYME